MYWQKQFARKYWGTMRLNTCGEIETGVEKYTNIIWILENMYYYIIIRVLENMYNSIC